jgi:hypothetical protein
MVNDSALKKLKEMEKKIEDPKCEIGDKKNIYRKEDTMWQPKFLCCDEMDRILCLKVN